MSTETQDQRAAECDDSRLIKALTERCGASATVSYSEAHREYRWWLTLELGGEMPSTLQFERDVAFQLGWLAFRALEELGNSEASHFFATLLDTLARKQGEANYGVAHSDGKAG